MRNRANRGFFRNSLLQSCSPDDQVVRIRFADRETQTRALGFLLGRFSGRDFATDEHLVPPAALDALRSNGFDFTIVGSEILH